MASKERAPADRTVHPLEEGAQRVLDGNWRGSHTVPAPGLYPHQWSWDSAFVAMGNAHARPHRAMREVETLLEAQWGNGLVPQIVFHEDSPSYFPGAAVYGSHRSPHAPGHVATSGLVQPPVHALAAWKVHRHAPPDVDTVPFLRRLWPKLLAWHRYLMRERDPEGSGAVTVLHPWETGMDNLPLWDAPLDRVDPRDLPSYERADLHHVLDPAERPTDTDYDRYLHLVLSLRERGYDTSTAQDHPFRVKSVVATSLLHASNQALLRIARVLGRDDTVVRRWQARIGTGWTRTFHPAGGSSPLPYPYDLNAGTHLEGDTVASLVPLVAGLPTQEQAESVLRLAGSPRFLGTAAEVLTSTATDHGDFAPTTYWRGPAWFNVNWLVLRGLQRYGFHDRAERLRRGLLGLVETTGHREYWNPVTGEGHGAEGFSWTAALTLDLLRDPGAPNPRHP